MGSTIIGFDDPAPETFSSVAGVVHDLGNLIQIAASAVNMLSRSPRTGRDVALEPVLARARTALERAGDLVRQNRGPIRPPAFDLRTSTELQDVASCIEDIQPLLAWICDPGITLAIELERDLPSIRCNRIELQNAVLNLVMNARDATPDGGSIRIVARRPPTGTLRDDLELSVIDDGAGMSRETMARAFNPYFTTKDDGRGTGLGLATVRRFASAMGGRADIISKPGEGTMVSLHLPGAGSRWQER